MKHKYIAALTLGSTLIFSGCGSSDNNLSKLNNTLTDIIYRTNNSADDSQPLDWIPMPETYCLAPRDDKRKRELVLKRKTPSSDGPDSDNNHTEFINNTSTNNKYRRTQYQRIKNVALNTASKNYSTKQVKTYRN